MCFHHRFETKLSLIYRENRACAVGLQFNVKWTNQYRRLCETAPAHETKILVGYFRDGKNGNIVITGMPSSNIVWFKLILKVKV